MTQVLQNNKIKKEHYKIHQIIKTTEDNMYRLDAEIVVEFQDIEVYQKTINFLIEKLEKSITVSKPNFYHSPGKLNELR